MSKDSSATYLHFHEPRLADLFEDFNKPYASASAEAMHGNDSHHTALASSNNPPGLSSYLPIEDIYVAPQYQPLNPEDEDDVVPDQHAEFGIRRAMDPGQRIVWRDLGLEELMRGMRVTSGVKGSVRRTAAAGQRMRIVCLR
ncbi:hypothetical protein KEM56_001442 [Ascosphaera pollenicola]|nr:hypothetical protein KEM56_001442 [Ascosphaera pollenicola]